VTVALSIYRANNNKFKTVDGVFCKTAQFKIAHKETLKIQKIVLSANKISM